MQGLFDQRQLLYRDFQRAREEWRGERQALEDKVARLEGEVQDRHVVAAECERALGEMARDDTPDGLKAQMSRHISRLVVTQVGRGPAQAPAAPHAHEGRCRLGPAALRPGARRGGAWVGFPATRAAAGPP